MSVSVGDPAPDFTLAGTNDSMHSLGDFAGQPLVLIFYPGDDTPVCTRQLNSYNDGLERFAEVDAQIVGISAQSVSSHDTFSDKHGFGFPLLADVDKEVAGRYGTLGPLGWGDKVVNAWFQGVTSRTAGFNTIDIGAMNETTLLGTSVLMFIGAGPASTSGGIKVTTFAVLACVIWAEVRGERDVNVFRRRLPLSMVRQAIAIALLSVGFVVVASLVLMASDGLALIDALFESTSAFGTVGLSTGVTGSISTLGHLVLVAIMLCGRVGPLTFATAIVLRHRSRLYRHAEERPIIG